RLDGHLTLKRSFGRDHLRVYPSHLVRSLFRQDVADGLADCGPDAGAGPSLGATVDERVLAREVLDKDENRSVITDGLELGVMHAPRRACAVALRGAVAQPRLGG